MEIKDIVKAYIQGNVFLAYWEGYDCDDGARPHKHISSFNFKEVKEWVEKNSKGWLGGMQLKWVPLNVEEDYKNWPKDVLLSYNGTNGNSRWTELMSGKSVEVVIPDQNWEGREYVHS